MECEVTERKKKILQAIVRDFVNTAEPVSSRTIAKRYDLGLSAATIRNEMADLEELGYLEQPHTSAGRIPSQKGYRFYVDRLMLLQQITENEVNWIKEAYQTGVHEIEHIIMQTAKLIAYLTNYTSLVSSPHLTKTTYRHIQLLPLDGKYLLVLVVNDLGKTENKIIEIPFWLKEEEIEQVNAVLNKRLCGLTLNEIKNIMITDLEQELEYEQSRRLLTQVVDVLKQILSSERDEKVYLGGATKILNQPEFKNVEKIKSLLEILEEEKLLSSILNEKNEDGLVVSIGDENKLEQIQDCSLITATYSIDGQLIGKIGVLGPTRMEYDRVVSTVLFMSKVLSEVLNQNFKM